MLDNWKLCYPYPNAFVTGYSFDTQLGYADKYSDKKRIWKCIEFKFCEYPFGPVPIKKQ